ncbi:MAG: carbohydrate binding domain-containing protein [Candidatus Izemoplasmatales bacterium]|jgi:hypothetical protein|nr:carbohydrate binding domain-containing protein [Candidatus Izemoplasmatales bacterium]
MKKVLFMFLMVFTVFAVAACNGVTTLAPTTEAPTTVAPTTEAPTTVAPTTGVQDTEAPVITGVDDITIYLNAVFDPMEGVSAIDNVDGDITDQVTVTGIVDTTKTGTNFLKYSVTDQAGNKKEETRYVTVEVDPNLIGDGIVQNGDFSLGNAVWNVTDGEGSSSTFAVTDEVGVLTVIAPSWNPWAPRLESNVIEFENGVTYEITFDAKADAVRSINVQVGQLLSGAPWFVDYKPGQPQIFDLSTDWQTFSFKFTMNNETGEGQLLFENGTVTGGVGTDNLATIIYYDNVSIAESTPDPDTTAPMISGAGDKLVKQNTVFDPLEGVTVVDNLDGNITITLSNVTGTVDTSTPGEYTITYTVSDEAGNVLVHERTITVYEDVEEPPMTEDYGWRSFLNDWEGTVGTMSVINGELVLELTSLNVNQGWHVQIIQDQFAIDGINDNEGLLQFETGKTYRITFDAKSSLAGDINVAIGHSVGGWYPYHMETVAVTTEMATYTFEFTLDNTELDYTTLAQLKFELGGMFSGQTAPQSFTLDNVLIEVFEVDAFVDANLVVNGNFDPITEPVMQETDNWRAFLNDWEGTSAEFVVIDGQLVLQLTNINASQSWQIQIIQDQFAIDGLIDNEGSMQFEAGKTYRVTFDAKSSFPGDINVAIGHSVGDWYPYHIEVVSVTTEMTTYSFEFTLDNVELDYTTLAQLKFELGLMFAGQAAPQSFVLDNVLIEVFEVDAFVDANLVLNGDFSEGAVIEAPAEETWTAYGTMTLDETETEKTITYVSGDANWWDSNVQGALVEFDGTNNAIVFTITGEAGHEYLFKFEGGGVFREIVFTASGVQEEITLDLSTLSEAERNGLNLVVLFNHNTTQSGTLVLHGWAYGNVIPQLPTPFGVVVSATEIVWGAIPEATSFEVYIDGVVGSPFAVAAGNYAFNLDALALEPGTYNITLKAIGDGVNYLDSNVTAVFEYVVASGPTQLATPFGVVITVDNLQWGALPDASSFEIYVDGVLEATVTGGTYSFDLATLALGAGTYDITIKAIGDGVDFLDSELSAAVQYTVIE